MHDVITVSNRQRGSTPHSFHMFTMAAAQILCGYFLTLFFVYNQGKGFLILSNLFINDYAVSFIIFAVLLGHTYIIYRDGLSPILLLFWQVKIYRGMTVNRSEVMFVDPLKASAPYANVCSVLIHRKCFARRQWSIDRLRVKNSLTEKAGWKGLFRTVHIR